MKDIINIIMIVCFISLFAFFAVESIEKETDEKRVEKILSLTERLPNSPLKNNLIGVIGAEYGGYSSQLNILISEFSKIKLEELQHRHE